MKTPIVQWNLVAAWIGILLGFISGFALGSNFHQEQWLGGYASHKRRLYRLGHISFFGLALMNLMFYFTARGFEHVSHVTTIAGAISMPLCCLIMAHQPKLRALFLVPVASLVTAAIITLWEVVAL